MQTTRLERGRIRRHALIQLLKLGPLKYREIVEITGWGKVCAWYLDDLMSLGEITKSGKMYEATGKPQ